MFRVPMSGHKERQVGYGWGKRALALCLSRSGAGEGGTA